VALRVSVESTILASISSSAHRSLLELEFRNGTIHPFLDVAPGCFHQLLASNSKGACFNRHIRNCFRHQRVSQPD
jgi:hypothetical protein